jgi:hypothetical protein
LISCPTDDDDNDDDDDIDCYENRVLVVVDPYILTSYVVLDLHQQNAQITNKVKSAPYHSRTLHMFRLSMSHHQGFSNSDFQMLGRHITMP